MSLASIEVKRVLFNGHKFARDVVLAAIVGCSTVILPIVYSTPAYSQTEQEQILLRLRKEAESGDRDAEFRLGEHLFLKWRNSNEAELWFKKAADKGHFVAMRWLGKNQYGNAEGLEYLRRSAEGGYAPAQTLYARVAYKERKLISCDQYIDLITKAADAKFAAALSLLRGEFSPISQPDRCLAADVKQQFRIGLRLLEAQKLEGRDSFSIANTYFNLAQMHQSGTGTPQDDVAAFRMFKEAADRGHRGAAYLVGEMYLKGVGTPIDAEASRPYLKKFLDSMPKPVPRKQ